MYIVPLVIAPQPLDILFCFFFLFYFFYFFNFYLFIYLFMAVLGLRFCARAFSSCGKRGHSSLRCAGLSLPWPLLLRSTGSRHAGSAVVAHGPSCSAAHGILPDQGSNPCPLHQQADSQPLRHQGSPYVTFMEFNLFNFAFIALSFVSDQKNHCQIQCCEVLPCVIF